MNSCFTWLLLICAIFAGYWLYDDFEPNLLSGRNVLITGASMGIGEQMAYHYARMGAHVMITARSEDRLKNVVKHCMEVGYKDGLYLYYVADMSNMNDTEKLLQVAIQKLGGIDFLVLNHIFTSPVGIWHGTKKNLTSLHEIMDVNFMSYIHLTSHALPELQRSRGSLLVISSVVARVSQPHFLPYSSSKFALDGFFTGYRGTLESQGISLTMCYLGLVDTDNAMAVVSTFSKMRTYVGLANSSDVAYDIIRGGARRQREVFSPHIPVKAAFLLNTVAPNLLQMYNNFLYSSD